jgi:hypothetical protein
MTAARLMLYATYWNNAKNKLSSMLYALCFMLYALCCMLYALCSMLCALCSVLCALCSMLYALYGFVDNFLRWLFGRLFMALFTIFLPRLFRRLCWQFFYDFLDNFVDNFLRLFVLLYMQYKVRPRSTKVCCTFWGVVWNWGGGGVVVCKSYSMDSLLLSKIMFLEIVNL